MLSKKIIVVGSSNMDMVVKTDHIPEPGETVLSGTFFMNPGGKGANQAVAVARLSGEVTFISKLGNDVFGKQFYQLFAEEGINTNYLLSDDNYPSGVALITVDNAGENSIVVASGANGQLHVDDLNAVKHAIDNAGIVLLQLETPLATVAHIANYAYSRAIKVILNPAPAQSLPASLLRQVDILTPNKKEASMIANTPVADLDSAARAAAAIHDKGVRNVVVTMGPLGAVVCESGHCFHVPSRQVETIDTTAAGDVFNGALAVALSEGKDLKTAVEFACEAAAFSVTRLGAQSSIPYRNEFIAHRLNLESNGAG